MGRFRDAISHNEAMLVMELESEHGLWVELQSRRILTDGQLQHCKSQVSQPFPSISIYSFNNTVDTSQHEYKDKTNDLFGIWQLLYKCDEKKHKRIVIRRSGQGA